MKRKRTAPSEDCNTRPTKRRKTMAQSGPKVDDGGNSPPGPSGVSVAKTTEMATLGSSHSGDPTRPAGDAVLNVGSCGGASASSKSLSVWCGWTEFYPGTPLSCDQELLFRKCLLRLWSLCDRPLRVDIHRPPGWRFDFEQEDVRARQPQQWYWMRNLEYLLMYMQVTKEEARLAVEGPLQARLVECHTYRHPPNRFIPIRPYEDIYLRYECGSSSLHVDIRGLETYLELVIYPAFLEDEKCLMVGTYTRWIDRGTRRAVLLQFDATVSEESSLSAEFQSIDVTLQGPASPGVPPC